MKVNVYPSEVRTAYPQLTFSTSNPLYIDYELIFFILNKVRSNAAHLERGVDETLTFTARSYQILITTESMRYQFSIGFTTDEQFLLFWRAGQFFARVRDSIVLNQYDNALLRSEFYCWSVVCFLLFRSGTSHDKPLQVMPSHTYSLTTWYFMTFMSSDLNVGDVFSYPSARICLIIRHRRDFYKLM